MPTTHDRVSILRRFGRSPDTLSSGLRLVVVFMISFLLISIALPTSAQKNSQDKSPASTPTASPTVSPTPLPLLEVSPMKALTPEELEKQKKEQEIPVLKTDTVMIVVTAAVRDDSDRNIPSLTVDDFAVYEDGVKQDISQFSNENSGVDIMILFDTTGSMGGEKTQYSKSALREFLKTCSDEDAIALMRIAEQTKNQSNLLQDFTKNRKDQIEVVSNKVIFVEAKGQTPLYDTVYAALDKLIVYNDQQTKLGKSNRKMAMLIVSDGQDNMSRYTYSDVKRAVKESNVVIYSIVIPPSANQDMDVDALTGRDIMVELAEMTGGKAYFPDFPRSLRFPDNPLSITRRPSMSLEEVFERIAQELRHQYQLAYYPTNKAQNGKWREIKVKVKAKGYPRLTVRTKKGYYPPKA